MIVKQPFSHKVGAVITFWHHTGFIVLGTKVQRARHQKVGEPEVY